MTLRSSIPGVSFVGSNPEAILRSVRSSPARNSEMTDAEMAAQMAIICVQNLWNSERAIMIQ